MGSPFLVGICLALAACCGGATRPSLHRTPPAASPRPTADTDPDRDGVVGLADLCPAEPEDRDGYEDGDGCPDPDDDGDRIPDAQDRCPREAEIYNGTDDEDGCPDRARVIVTEIVDYILDKIYFRAGDATIRPPSEPILDAIAATLRAEPELVVEVSGHRDRGERDATLGLQRARAVVDALVARGVEAARLHVADRDATRPIDRGRGAAAAERNRRVEFQVLPGPRPVAVDRPDPERALPDDERVGGP